MSTRTLLMPLPILAEPVGGLAHRFAPSLFSGGRVSVALTAAWRLRRLAERRANAAEALCTVQASRALPEFTVWNCGSRSLLIRAARQETFMCCTDLLGVAESVRRPASLIYVVSFLLASALSSVTNHIYKCVSNRCVLHTRWNVCVVVF